MRIGVPKETKPGENLVAATPKTVDQLAKLGYEVVVERGAGSLAAYPDSAFDEAGAQVAGLDDVYGCDIVMKVRAPDAAEIARLKPGQTIASLMQPALNPDLLSRLAEQVESMGAQFVTIDMEQEVSADGYAKEMTPEQQQLVMAMYDEQARQSDIVITTALIPGRPAPRLITAETVVAMKPGSVIVDMAAANGGNVEPSRPDEKVVTANGVKILGWTDLAGRLPTQASQLYGTNLVNLLKLTTPGKDGQLVLDWSDPVQRSMTVAHGGEVMWPPPPVAVSAAPAAAAQPTAPVEPKPVKQPMSPGKRLALIGVAALVFLLIAAISPEAFLGHFMVFMLSVVIGFYVIGNVHHALHTPLMSVTNAISGIIVVGALLQVGHPGKLWVSVLAFIGILVASINVFGGFTVTGRMLQMFKREDATR